MAEGSLSTAVLFPFVMFVGLFVSKESLTTVVKFSNMFMVAFPPNHNGQCTNSNRLQLPDQYPHGYALPSNMKAAPAKKRY